MKIQTYGVLLLAAALGGLSGPARAGEVDVVDVVVRQSAAGVYRFDVTLRHADSGWDHYADAWEIRDGDGAVLATRVLVHPHVDEQPFTRSLGGVRLPDSLKAVTIAGHDSEHGYGGMEMTVDLPE
ncbi:MAG: hypothetical protein IIC08_03985 [Proteobacteria bacterium]|nr:hypothetical protein [Pseudomonadota bacterium]